MMNEDSLKEATKPALRPSKGKGTMLIGYLMINVGITFLLDSNLFHFSVGLMLIGHVLFLFGHLQNFFVLRAFKKKS